jgi:hypothetical protein
MALSTAFLTRIEENMRTISEDAYAGAIKNRWADKVLKELPSTASAEHLHFLLTGGTMDYSTEGNVRFEDQTVGRIDLTPQFFDAPGLKILRSELEDSDGAGLSKSADWSSKIAVQAALFPQRKLAAMLLAGSATCYDGLSLFNAAHPNMFGGSNGTFANDLTGAASGIFPGAVPITGTAEVANANLGRAIAYIRSLVSTDGATPRGMEPKYLVCSPSLYRQALIASQSRFVGGSSLGSTDVQSVISDFNIETIMAPELLSDTAYYIFCAPVGTEVGGAIYLNREPVTVQYHGPMTSAELARSRTFQWTCAGRAVVAPGRPEFVFRCRAT